VFINDMCSVGDTGAAVNFKVDIYQPAGDAGYGGGIEIKINSPNPEFNDLAWIFVKNFKERDMEEVRGAAAAHNLPLIRKPWGFGWYRSWSFEAPVEKGEGTVTVITHEGEFAGLVGDVQFRIFERGGGYDSPLESMAGRLAALAGADLLYDNLARAADK
jgi:hypothetical protein